MEIDLTIEQTGPHEAIPYELLYEADPSREAVADYIARGSCYIARIEGRTASTAVATPEISPPPPIGTKIYSTNGSSLKISMAMLP